ncbi:hypothetical protein [Nocardia wallacei]|uniref:hypothetical protein n=1 Tax=Nocardia wallacei TaxID=480035 RepID=UPI0024541FD8|nr:hypothetical protein [Nocardia wallacei]
MSEQVIRHRGGGMDDDGNPVDSTDTPLAARAVAPGATAEYADRGRNGETVEYSVYFYPAADLRNDDELTVRGDRYAIQVEQWRSPYTTRTGTVALCSAGKG